MVYGPIDHFHCFCFYERFDRLPPQLPDDGWCTHSVGAICHDSSCTILELEYVAHGGGGVFIVKVPGDVPPARVCFFKPSSLAKGILFANFSPFSLGKGILFWQFWSKKCQTSVIPAKKPTFFSNFGP